MTPPSPPIVVQLPGSRGFHLSLGLVLGIVAGMALLLHLLNRNPALAAWLAGAKAELANAPSAAKRIQGALDANRRLALHSNRLAHRADSIGKHDSLLAGRLDSLQRWMAAHPGDTGATRRFVAACQDLTASCSERAETWRQAHVTDSLRADSLRQALDSAAVRARRTDSLIQAGIHVHATRCGWSIIAGGGPGVISKGGVGLTAGLMVGWGCRP